MNCEYCGVTFWRKRAKRDARRFCSKRCSGARIRARTAAAKAERTLATAFAAAFRRELDARLPAIVVPTLERRCPCGAPRHTRSKYCLVCLRPLVAARVRAGRSAVTFTGLDHVCPNCGATFKGYEADTYCSRPCATQYRHRVDRGSYPRIGHMGIKERNTLAELIALMRAANRRIHGKGASGA